MLLEFDYYVNLQSLRRLKISGSFHSNQNLWRLIQILSWSPLLASVEIAPFRELYKLDRTTENMLLVRSLCTALFIKHCSLVCKQHVTFLFETSSQNDTYWVKCEDSMELTGWDKGFIVRFSCVNRLGPALIQRRTFLKYYDIGGNGEDICIFSRLL